MRMNREVSMSSRISIGNANLAILNGEADLSLWSDEELRRGQRRDRKGHWSGRPPKVIPKAIHDELVRRTYDEASKLLQDSLVDAVTLFGVLVRDEKADPAVRLKAASIIVERVMGRAPMTLHVDVQPKWQAAITHAVVSIPAHLIEGAIEARGSAVDEDDPIPTNRARES